MSDPKWRINKIYYVAIIKEKGSPSFATVRGVELVLVVNVFRGQF